MENREPINWRFLAVAVGIFILLAGWAGTQDYKDAVQAEAAYCENVYRFYATGGSEGHPDYNQNYADICEVDLSVEYFDTAGD